MRKAYLKRTIPDPIWKRLSQVYWWWYNRGRHRLARSLHPAWRNNTNRVQTFQDCHQGQRAFILGNGPSLRQTDLSLLREEITFGLNRIYLLFPELGFRTSYLVSVNELVLEQCTHDLRGLDMPKFLTWRARGRFLDDPHTLFLDSDYTGPENFSYDLSGRVYEGFTVTYVALQLAFYMGIKEVILVGVDHNFQTQGPANTTIVSTGDDLNHFSTDYFGPGFRWQLPDLNGSERAYRLARSAYEQAGRRVLDGTIGGNLDIFPKVEYASLF